MKKSMLVLIREKSTIKKLLCLLCVSALVVGVAPLEFASALDQTVMLADFSDPAVATAFGLTTDTERVYPGSTASARWNPNSASTNERILADYSLPTDWSEYSYVNLRVYSPKKNAGTFGLICKKASTWGGGRYHGDIPLVWEGWKEISFPLNAFVSYDSMNSWITVNRFYFSGINSGLGVESGVEINFDSIWLSKTKSNSTVTVEADADTLTLARFSTLESIIEPFGLPKLTPDYTNTRLYDFSANWTLTSTSPQAVTIPLGTIDMTGYNYLNALVYSPSEKATVVSFLLQSGSTLTDSTRHYYQTPVNWTGWRLISVPLETLSKNGTPDLSKVIALRLHSKVNTAVNPVSGTSLSFDKIWLSKDATSGTFTLCDKGVLDNATDVPVYQTQAEITFSRQLPPLPANSTVTVSALGDTPHTVRHTLSAEGGTLKIKMIDQLLFGTQYVIRIHDNFVSDYAQILGENIDIQFQTADYDVSLNQGGSVWDGKSGTIDSVSITQAVLDAQPGMIWIAKYQGNTLVEVVPADIQTLTFAPISVSTGDTIRVFIWRENFAPICPTTDFPVS